MAVQIFLIIYHNQWPPRAGVGLPAHWCIFIPCQHPFNPACISYGKVIRCIGVINPEVGLSYSSYVVSNMIADDITRTARRYSKIPIGIVRDSHVDLLEDRASEVRVPEWRGNLNLHAGEDCQTWIKNYVRILVEEGIFASSAMDILARAPRY